MTSFVGENELDPDAFTVCPFNPLHVVQNKRIAYHIAKCSKQQGHRDMVTCPYNAKHVHPRSEHEHHVLHCADRSVIDHVIAFQNDKNIGFTGNVSLPSYNNTYESEENWDEEPSFSFTSGNFHHTQVRRLPRQEPIVLEAETQADSECRFRERQKQRQINAPDGFLSSGNDTEGSSYTQPSGNVSRMNSGFTNKASVVKNPSAAMTLSGFGRGLAPRSLPNSAESQNMILEAATPGRNRQVDPVTFGRGRSSLQQNRRVTVTPSFSLPGIDRGYHLERK